MMPSREGQAATSEVVDTVVEQYLDAMLSLDAARDTVHVDVAGSLTARTRPALLDIVARIRQLQEDSSIAVHVGGAARVESGGLAGLREDLEDRAASSGSALASAKGVSLETRARPGAAQPADLTDDDLLAASDFTFRWLDDPDGCPGTDVAAMVAGYHYIVGEITLRSGT